MTIHSNLRKDGCRRKSLVFQEWVTQQDFVKIVSKWEGSRMADVNPYKWTACHPAWIFKCVFNSAVGVEANSRQVPRLTWKQVGW